MDNIKLALQGYNYDNGYIAWAQEHYKGYSTANALEFSNLMELKQQNMNLLSDLLTVK